MKFTFRPISTWPGTKTGWGNQRSSPFSAHYSDTLEKLEMELEKLGASSAVIEIDLQECHFRIDGLPRSNAPQPHFSGVVLSFDSDHGPLRYPCDRFNKWKDNVRAIALTLERLRSVGRYGVTSRGEQYKGWRQLPAAGHSLQGASELLQTYCGYTSKEIAASSRVALSAYREAARITHPDVPTGSDESFRKVREAATVLGVS